MIKINYPPYQPRIKVLQGKEWIFDQVRRQWIILTPEEWVRQNFLQFIIEIKRYPPSLIAVEREIQLGDISKRFDIVVFGRNALPWMMVECKEMKVALGENTLRQALNYNITLQVPYILITNGSFCYGFKSSLGQLVELSEMPDYPGKG